MAVGGDKNPSPVNNLPVANDDTVQLKFLETLSISVLDNDTDADGDSLSIEIVTQPASGSVSIQGNQISYAANDTTGDFSFDYRVFDGKGYSPPAKVTVNVEALVITLNGRVVPVVEAATVIANLSTQEETSTYQAVSTSNGEYSIDLMIDENSDLSGFVSLQAETSDGGKYFLSNVASVAKLRSKIDATNSVSYLTIPQLELSAFSTAVYTYMNFEDSDNLISDDVEMEVLLEKSANSWLYKLATLIFRVNSQQTALPDGISSIAELLNNKTKVALFVNSISDIDVQNSSLELLGQITYLDTTENFSEGVSFQYTYASSLLAGKSSPVAINKKADSTVQISRLISPKARYSSSGTIEIDLLFNSAITPEKTFKLTALNGQINVIQTNIGNCGRNISVYYMLDEVEYRRVFSGDNLDQYLVKYSGETIIGSKDNPPCPWLSATGWSQIELINVKKNQSSWTEILSSNQIAVSVGDTHDNWGSTSPSLVDLNPDGSTLVELNNRTGTWSYNESGRLNLGMSDGVSIEYEYQQTEGLASRYIAYKTDVDGKNSVFSGLLVQVDPNFTVDSLVGRYEVTTEYSLPSGFAFSFQNDYLGQESSVDSEGNWKRVASFGVDIYYYNWKSNSDRNGIHTEYLVKVNGPSDYINYSSIGCEINDSTCYLWKTRDFRFLARDGDYYYVMMNARSDLTFDGYPEDILTYGYVGIYHKVDFILPPVY